MKEYRFEQEAGALAVGLLLAACPSLTHAQAPPYVGTWYTGTASVCTGEPGATDGLLVLRATRDRWA
jgi:hypothetical protein